MQILNVVYTWYSSQGFQVICRNGSIYFKQGNCTWLVTMPAKMKVGNIDAFVSGCRTNGTDYSRGLLPINVPATLRCIVSVSMSTVIRHWYSSLPSFLASTTVMLRSLAISRALTEFTVALWCINIDFSTSVVRGRLHT